MFDHGVGAEVVRPPDKYHGPLQSKIQYSIQLFITK
jgi:hypothetical protein